MAVTGAFRRQDHNVASDASPTALSAMNAFTIVCGN